MSQELNDTKEHFRIARFFVPEDAAKWINKQCEEDYTLQGMMPVQAHVWVVMRWNTYLKEVRNMKGQKLND